MKKNKDLYREHAGFIKNEAELQEELEEDALELGDVERKHFEEDELN